MQREESDGIVIVCDFCRRDWDGQEPMIEGHHGSILCLECLKRALDGLKDGGEKYTCTLCLRFNIPPTVPRWSNPESTAEPAAVACQECLYQAAKTFSRNEDNTFQWDSSRYPPLQKA